jgi:hypothetical protein
LASVLVLVLESASVLVLVLESASVLVSVSEWECRCLPR